MNGISSNNPKLLRSVSTPALCRVPLSDPWDQQQHRAWEHQGVGGQQRDCGLWGKDHSSWAAGVYFTNYAVYPVLFFLISLLVLLCV